MMWLDLNEGSDGPKFLQYLYVKMGHLLEIWTTINPNLS
jgi:hypothetical protein